MTSTPDSAARGRSRSTIPIWRTALAQSGIEKWTVDTAAMTMTFYDKAGKEMLVEQIE